MDVVAAHDDHHGLGLATGGQQCLMTAALAQVHGQRHVADMQRVAARRARQPDRMLDSIDQKDVPAHRLATAGLMPSAHAARYSVAIRATRSATVGMS